MFSLGVVLYEMLVRRTPFERAGDNTVFAVMHRIAGEAHAPVTGIDPKIPPAFDAILARALAKSPDQRYQRAGDMANDLRSLRAMLGGASPAQAEDAKTMVVPRAAVQPSPDGSAATTTLIQDLDVFARDFERQQQETLRMEAAELARKEEAIRLWAEEEERRRQEFERERDAKAGVTQLGARRSAAIDMLKKKAAGRAVEVSAEQLKRAEANQRVDERLRAAFRYLSEFATVLNEANPASEGCQGVMFFGDRDDTILGECFTDMRTRDVYGKSCGDFVTLKYRVRFPKPEKLEVNVQEAQRIRERLVALGVKHDYAERKNPAGQVTQAVFTTSGPFPCQAVLRADYDDPGFDVELMNVRHHGVAKLRLSPEELNDDVLDQFGTWVLGADDAFERFLKRRP
jgi:hypothetical protein